jgi:DNA-binding CsgD family transcriptional regulator
LSLAVSLADDTEQSWLQPFLHSAAALVLAAEGQWEQAEAYVAAAVKGANAFAPGDVSSVCFSGEAAAHLAAARGDHARVLEAVAPLVALPEADGVEEPGIVSWRPLQAEALVALGRVDEANEALGPWEALATVRGRRSAMAEAARARGQVAWAQGDKDRAETSFEAGRALLADLSMPFHRALLEYAHGRLLRRAGRRREATGRLNEAHRLFAVLGARPYAAECERELGACGLRPTKRKVRDRTRLTPQELAVARLVASGLTNAEVAARLVVSVKTVEFHLGNVFSKLTITSRRQLASHQAVGETVRAGAPSSP